MCYYHNLHILLDRGQWGHRHNHHHGNQVNRNNYKQKDQLVYMWHFHDTNSWCILHNDLFLQQKTSWITWIKIYIFLPFLSPYQQIHLSKRHDCCLTPTQQFFQLYHGENKLIFNDDDEVRFVQDQHAELDFYSASSLTQPSVDRHVAPYLKGVLSNICFFG